MLSYQMHMHFNPVVVLNHFVAQGMAEPSTMWEAKEESLDKRTRVLLFFVKQPTCEKKCLAQAKRG